MKRIFSIIMERDLAYPRALLPSGGLLSREFYQLTTPLTDCPVNLYLFWS